MVKIEIWTNAAVLAAVWASLKKCGDVEIAMYIIRNFFNLAM